MKLFKLPSVVKKHVFKMMDEGEKLELAFTSKQMKMTIQSTRVTKDYDMSIDFQKHTIDIRGVREYSAVLEGHLHHGGNTKLTTFDGKEKVLVEMNGSRHCCYWETNEQRQVGFYKMIVYLLSKLDIKIISNLTLAVQRSALETLHFLNAKEISFGDVVFTGKPLGNMDIAGIIFSYDFLRRVNNQFTTFAALPVFTTPRFPNSASLNVQNVYMDDSGWLSVNHLLSFKKARDIELYQSSLENKDLQKLLRSWRNGNFQELSCIKIVTEENLDIKEVTKDLVDQQRVSTSAFGEKVMVYGKASLRGEVEIYFQHRFIFEAKTVKEIFMDN